LGLQKIPASVACSVHTASLRGLLRARYSFCSHKKSKLCRAWSRAAGPGPWRLIWYVGPGAEAEEGYWTESASSSGWI